jgi:hypothetical protein
MSRSDQVFLRVIPMNRNQARGRVVAVHCRNSGGREPVAMDHVWPDAPYDIRYLLFPTPETTHERQPLLGRDSKNRDRTVRPIGTLTGSDHRHVDATFGKAAGKSSQADLDPSDGRLARVRIGTD